MLGIAARKFEVWSIFNKDTIPLKYNRIYFKGENSNYGNKFYSKTFAHYYSILILPRLNKMDKTILANIHPMPII